MRRGRLANTTPALRGCENSALDLMAYQEVTGFRTLAEKRLLHSRLDVPG